MAQHAQFARAARRRRRRRIAGLAILVLCLAGGAIGAFLYAVNQPTLYGATTMVRVYDPGAVSSSTASKIDPLRLVALEVSYARSPQTSDNATSALEQHGVTFNHVTWNGASDQDAISVTCYARRATAAQTCAEQFANSYISLRKVDAGKSLSAAASRVGVQLRTVTRQLTQVQTTINNLKQPIVPEKAKALLAEQASLLSQQDALGQQQASFNAQAAGIDSTYSIVAHAVVPKSPSSPKPLRDVAIAMAAGLILGLAIILLIQQSGQTPREDELPPTDFAPVEPGAGATGRSRRRRAGRNAADDQVGAPGEGTDERADGRPDDEARDADSDADADGDAGTDLLTSGSHRETGDTGWT